MKVAAIPFATVSLDTGYEGPMTIEGTLKKRKNNRSLGLFIGTFNTRYFMLDLANLKFCFLKNENQSNKKAKEISLKEIKTVKCDVFNYTKDQGVWAFPLHIATVSRNYWLIARDELFYCNLIKAFQYLINNVTKQPLFEYCRAKGVHQRDVHFLTARTQTSPEGRNYEQLAALTEGNATRESSAAKSTLNPQRKVDNRIEVSNAEDIQPNARRGWFISPVVVKVKSLSGARYKPTAAADNKIEVERKAGNHEEKHQQSIQDIRNQRKAPQNGRDEECGGDIEFPKRKIQQNKENAEPNLPIDNNLNELRLKTWDMIIPKNAEVNTHVKKLIANYSEKVEHTIVDKAEMYEDWD